jgi:hypothetical protein
VFLENTLLEQERMDEIDKIVEYASFDEDGPKTLSDILLIVQSSDMYIRMAEKNGGDLQQQQIFLDVVSTFFYSLVSVANIFIKMIIDMPHHSDPDAWIWREYDHFSNAIYQSFNKIMDEIDRISSVDNRDELNHENESKSISEAHMNDSKIKWNGTERNIVSLFYMLSQSGPVDFSTPLMGPDTYSEAATLISKHFLNKNNKPFSIGSLQTEKARIMNTDKTDETGIDQLFGMFDRLASRLDEERKETEL